MTDANVWNANLLRLTVFPEPDYQIDKDWWENVVGEIPEQENAQPRQGIIRYEGLYNIGRLILSIQPTRLDWIFTNKTDPNEPELDTLGVFSEVLETFVALMTKWLKLDTSPNILRIAFGAILEQPVKSPQDGYELLEKRYLRFNPQFDADTSDFLFQINRPRMSQSIENLRINRLTKWSVSRSQTILILPIRRNLPESFAIRLEVDINSDPNFNISSTNTESLLNELVSLGYEIAEKGDLK